MTRATVRAPRTLVRARNLATFRRALVDLALEGPPLEARRRVMLVPTRASAEILRQTIESHAAAAGRAAIILPDLLTREEFMARLAVSAGTGALLTRLEREVLFERAARATLRTRTHVTPPFTLRPGLVAAMLDFYDSLKRRRRTVRRFARTMFDELRGERGADRGSESLVAQTMFLGFAFLAYERGVRASGSVDEHTLRALVVAGPARLSCDHIIVAVADRPTETRGLWPVDFDLLGRLPGLARVDVVMTDEVHDAGFRERLDEELPGMVEQRAPEVPNRPVLVVPPGDGPRVAFVTHDREEELRDVVRAIRASAADTEHQLRASAAIVFQRPLPYLYLAQQVLQDARVPYQAFDALPLAAEPYAALLDVVLTVAATGGTREGVIALLRSPLLAFEIDGVPVGPMDVAALDRLLMDGRATGDASTYEATVERALARETRGGPARAAAARRAARVATGVAEALAVFRAPVPTSVAIEAVSTFLRDHERIPADASDVSARYRRARAGVLAVLDGFAAACRRFDDTSRSADTLVAQIHHALETRTFTPRLGEAGVHLADAVAARFGEFDRVFVVGLVETEWPERPTRSIFYARSLLVALGWPREPDHLRAERAAFRDLVTLARQETRLSAFELEGDAVVGVSPLLDAAEGLARVDAPARVEAAVFTDELIGGTSMPVGLAAGPAAWLALRHRRPLVSARAYAGFVGAQLPRIYRVSQVDRYVDCPFKYFAGHVLGLDEERDEAALLTPLERGTLLHAVFEEFYTRWQAEGRGAITAASIPAALDCFGEIAAARFESLSPSDRALEETRMLGSIVGRGFAERVFELEADAGVGVVDRLLERKVEGAFTFPGHHGLRPSVIEIRGKADRVDVLADGSLRVIDYKLGQLPDLDRSIQVAVYGHAIRHTLREIDGVDRPVSTAMYLAFGDDRRLEGKIGRSDDMGAAIEARASDFADSVERIEQGEFPPRPLRPAECAWCAYAGVCRKEYRQEDDEAAEPV